MSILWIYDKVIDPHAGGTERATHLIMSSLAELGHPIAGFVVFQQNKPRAIFDMAGNRIDNLYEFLKAHEVSVVVNQIGYSKWLLKEFLARGGARWREEGGRIVTKLHFDPIMFSTSVRDLCRHWRRRSVKQKLRRLARITLLPLERRKAAKTLREAYRYLLEQSDTYVILSEKHRRKLLNISGTSQACKVCVISNPNTFSVALPPGRVPLKSRTALVVSRLDEPQKRVSLALLAWGKAIARGEFEGWRLKVLGDGDYYEDYRKLVSKKRIRSVEFVGRVDPEPFYEDAAIYLHTAKREGWGLTIAEAMQKGVVPVVMHSCPIFDELIDNGENGLLVDDGNISDFAIQLATLMRSKERRENMALRAIRASQTRSSDKIVQEWSRILNVT